MEEKPNTTGEPTPNSSFEAKIEASAEKIGQRMEQVTKEYERDGSYVWAVFLIFIGIIFLLNTTNVVPWSVWSILWKFWPVFIVLAGVRILVGRSRVTSFLLSVLAIIIFLSIGIAGVLSVKPALLEPWGVKLPSWWQGLIMDIGEEQTKTVVIDGQSYRSLIGRDYEFDLGLGEITITDSDSDDHFRLVALYYDKLGVPVIKESEIDKILNVKFTQESESFSFGLPRQPKYDFTLGNKNIPSSIDIDCGAGVGRVSFSELAISNLRANVGAGSLTVDLQNEKVIPREGIDFRIGAGEVLLQLPQTVGYRIEYELGVGSIKIDDTEVATLGAKDDSYESNNYNKVESNLVIKVDVGVGRFELKTK